MKQNLTWVKHTHPIRLVIMINYNSIIYFNMNNTIRSQHLNKPRSLHIKANVLDLKVHMKAVDHQAKKVMQVLWAMCVDLGLSTLHCQ